MDNELLLQRISDMMDRELDKKLEPIHERLRCLDYLENQIDGNVESINERIHDEHAETSRWRFKMDKEVREIKAIVRVANRLSLEL